MLAEKSDIIKNTASTMYQLSAEEKIRLQCEARERYEHDIASYLAIGRKDGEKIGMERGEKIGKADERMSLVLAMLSNGMPPEEISAKCNLPLEEVLQIVKSTAGNQH